MARPIRTTYVVKQLEMALRSRLDDIVRGHNLTTQQFTVLSVLDNHPGMSSADLAVRSFVSPQSANQMVALLERQGLITRAADETNRRVLRISLTDAGYEALAACEPELDALEKEMTGALDPETRRRLRADLTTCVRSITSAPGSSSDGRVAKQKAR